jgi:hypothetical protein
MKNHNKNNVLETYIVGSYLDENFKSKDNLDLMIRMMYESDITFLIKCCYILDLNTATKQVTIDTRFLPKENPHFSLLPNPTTHTYDKQITVNYPIFSSLIYETRTGQIYTGEFEDKGPEFALRQASGFLGEDTLICTYDHETDRYVIGPNEYQKYTYRNFLSPKATDFFLNAPDQIILGYMSTSPFAEGKSFTSEMKSVLKFIKENPHWQKLYPNNKPIQYKRSPEGKWIRI